MIKLLTSLVALLAIFYLTMSWHVISIGGDATVTKIGYIVLMLFSVFVFYEIEGICGSDDGDNN